MSWLLYARQQKRHRCKEQTVGLRGRRRGDDFERIALKHVYYRMWNRLPVQVQCIRQGAQGWCTGMMGWGGRWEGGSGWGTHVHLWLIHVNVWQKSPQYCKVISLQLKKEKKRNKYSKSNICPADFFCQVGLYMGSNFLFKLLLALLLLLKTFSFPSKSIY